MSIRLKAKDCLLEVKTASYSLVSYFLQLGIWFCLCIWNISLLLLTCFRSRVLQLITQVLNVLVVSLCRSVIQKLKIWGQLQKGGGQILKFQWGKQKGVEQDFWLKFSGEKNLGRNYDKINPTAFVPNSIYICFFGNPIFLWQKHVKQNGVKYNECGNITQMSLNNVQWRNNIKKKLWKPYCTNS